MINNIYNFPKVTHSVCYISHWWTIDTKLPIKCQRHHLKRLRTTIKNVSLPSMRNFFAVISEYLGYDLFLPGVPLKMYPFSTFYTWLFLLVSRSNSGFLAMYLWYYSSSCSSFYCISCFISECSSSLYFLIFLLFGWLSLKNNAKIIVLLHPEVFSWPLLSLLSNPLLKSISDPMETFIDLLLVPYDTFTFHGYYWIFYLPQQWRFHCTASACHSVPHRKY